MGRTPEVQLLPIDSSRPAKGFDLACNPSQHELSGRIFACGLVRGQTLDDVKSAFKACFVRASPWLDGAKVRAFHAPAATESVEDELAPMWASLALGEHKVEARRMNIADLPDSLSAHEVVRAVNDLLRGVEAPVRFGVLIRWRGRDDDCYEGSCAVLRVVDDERESLAALGYAWDEPVTPPDGQAPPSYSTIDADRPLIPKGKVRRRESGISFVLAAPALIHGFLCPAGTEVGLDEGRVDGVLFREGVQVGEVALGRLAALRRVGAVWVADGVLVGTTQVDGVTHKAPTELLVTAEGVIVVRRRRRDEETRTRDRRESAELEAALERRRANLA